MLVRRGTLSWEQKNEIWKTCKNIKDRQWEFYEKYYGNFKK